jgi:hypothetical protein
LKLGVVEAADRILRRLGGFHFNEAKALGTPRGAIGDHTSGDNRPNLGEKRAQIFVSRAIAQIANIQFLSHKILSIAVSA